MLREPHQIAADAFVDLKVWRVPDPVQGSKHTFRYALAYVIAGECVLRYDNEAGQGDHKHLGSEEVPYDFSTPAKLLADFWSDVDRWRRK